MREAGLLLVPYVAFVAYVGTRASISRARPCKRSSRSTCCGSWAASACCSADFVAPTVLGTAFVIAQAAVVGGVRRTAVHRAAAGIRRDGLIGCVTCTMRRRVEASAAHSPCGRHG